jgi:hypothetical protein
MATEVVLGLVALSFSCGSNGAATGLAGVLDGEHEGGLSAESGADAGPEGGGMASDAPPERWDGSNDHEDEAAQVREQRYPPSLTSCNVPLPRAGLSPGNLVRTLW